MTQHEVNIGSRVKSSDGKHLGSVEQLIVNAETNRVGGFLLGKGILSGDKIVGAGLVASTDADGIVLSIDAAGASSLPEHIEEQRVRSSGPLTYSAGYGMVDIQGTSNQWYMRGPTGGDLPNTGTDSFYMQAPIGDVTVENISNLDADSITLSEGTDVIGSDGKKVGHVDEVFVEDRRISAFLVRAGFLFHHDVRIPMSLVAGMTHERVRLNVTADEAERQSQAEDG